MISQEPCHCQYFCFYLPEDYKTPRSWAALGRGDLVTCCNRPSWPSLQKALWGNALWAVIGSPSFSEKEKRERSVLEGEGSSSPNLDAHACPDTRKSPAAEIFFSLGDGGIRLLSNVCGFFPGRASMISKEQALFFFLRCCPW